MCIYDFPFRIFTWFEGKATEYEAICFISNGPDALERASATEKPAQCFQGIAAELALL